MAAASTTGLNTTFASAAKSVASGDSTGVANVVGRAVSVLAGNTWNGTTGDSPAMWTLLWRRRRELSGAATPTANAEAVAPTLVVGDYDLFATTPLHVVSFYGTQRVAGAAGNGSGRSEFRHQRLQWRHGPIRHRRGGQHQ